MIALKEPIFENQGPRDWTPRVGSALRKVEFLLSLIPSEILHVLPDPETHWDSLTHKQMARIFFVRVRKWKKPWAPDQFELLDDNVWINEDGRIITEAGIRDLLSGGVPGYEPLAGRWERWLAAAERKFSPELFQERRA